MNLKGSGELQEYPCDFMFKAFGPGTAASAFASGVQEAVARVVPVGRDAIKQRRSSGGKFICVTVLVRLQTKEQTERIYAELRGVEGLNYLL